MCLRARQTPPDLLAEVTSPEDSAASDDTFDAHCETLLRSVLPVAACLPPAIRRPLAGADAHPPRGYCGPDEAECNVRAFSERLDLAMQNTEGGLWDWDLASGAIVLDDNWREILGYTDRDAAAKPEWISLVHPG